jgi:hypothetical protein
LSINPENNISEEITQARFGSELWKIFAVLTLLLALIEMTVARSMKRDLAVINIGAKSFLIEIPKKTTERALLAALKTGYIPARLLTNTLMNLKNWHLLPGLKL